MNNAPFFQKRYRQFFGKEVQPFQLFKCIRVNTLKTDETSIIERLKKKGVKLEKIPFTLNGYRIMQSRFSLGATPEFLMGYYYLQEAASQVPVEVLDPQPGEKVLDMCAAPGGKTTQIAQHMKNQGLLVALDSKKKRLQSLEANCERLGVQNCVAYAMEGQSVAKLGIEFDRILLDAPCSGNCITDRNWFSKRSITGIKSCAAIQKDLLTAAVDVLKVGGVLVYSTCSLEPEENEEVIQWALSHLPLELTSTNLTVGMRGIDMPHATRFHPNDLKTQGFFVTRLVKK